LYTTRSDAGVTDLKSGCHLASSAASLSQIEGVRWHLESIEAGKSCLACISPLNTSNIPCLANMWLGWNWVHMSLKILEIASSCIADAAFLQWRISPALIDAETRRRPHCWLTGAILVYDGSLEVQVQVISAVWRFFPVLLEAPMAKLSLLELYPMTSSWRCSQPACKTN
jgi:hypothetical protein